MEMFWVEQTGADLPSGEEWLCAAERARLAALRIPKRRAEWRLGRWTAKAAVISYLGLYTTFQQLAGVEIRASASGAPEAFWEDQPAPVAISLTHRDGVAACTIGRPGARFGCDLELSEPRESVFVDDYFADEEQQLVSRTSGQQRPQLVTLIWSAKESALKALQTGLRCDTRCVVVRLDDDANPSTLLDNSSSAVWSALSVQYGESEMFHGWWRFDGRFIRTLVSAEPVMPPLSLRIRVCDQQPGPECVRQRWEVRQHSHVQGELS
jgi:4'-phosphopantetheinyl transferase